MEKCDGGSEGGEKGPTQQGMVTTEVSDFEQASNHALEEVDRSFKPILKIARVLCRAIHRTHGVPTSKDTTVAYRVIPRPRTGTPSEDGITRQRSPVGHSLYDEQWSDHL